MNGRPLASAAYEAAIALYNRIRHCPDGDPGALGDVFSQLPGHVETHVLDLPDGSIWAATFLAVLNDNADAADRDPDSLIQYAITNAFLRHSGSLAGIETPAVGDFRNGSLWRVPVDLPRVDSLQQLVSRIASYTCVSEGGMVTDWD
jgi:hypothetical protein